VIKFGTDGWRAIMADEFVVEKVRVVATAIAQYLKKEGIAEQGIVVGYDTRFLSETFAREVARVFLGAGIPAEMAKRYVPTPVIAYSVKDRKRAGAIMITASHNPPEYNGIKFIPRYAGPATTDITKQIEKELRTVIANSKEISLGDASHINYFDPAPRYLKHLSQFIDWEMIRHSGIKVIIDPLYGTAMDYLDKIFKENACSFEVIHNWRDPYFGGSNPEPSKENLSELKQKLFSTNAQLGLATDGDADRFGIIDEDGEYISPNYGIALLLYHLVENKGWRGPIGRTVATTHLLDRLARKYGLLVLETPVGFKYIGALMRERDLLIGGEESGGVSVKTHIPEKDGILACAMISELRAKAGKTLGELLKDIMEDVGFVYNERINLHCEEDIKKQKLEFLYNSPPQRLADIEVENVVTLDGIKFLLSDGSWLLIRPSGTEPIVRIYAESERLEIKDKLISVGKEFFVK